MIYLGEGIKHLKNLHSFTLNLGFNNLRYGLENMTHLV